MDFIKNIFKLSNSQAVRMPYSDHFEQLPFDEAFAKKFIDKNGRFLYCLDQQEVLENFKKIGKENNWTTFNCFDKNVLLMLKNNGFSINNDLNRAMPVLVSCEYLIAENGGILLSSNQLKDHKIANLSDDFVVFAKTSQIVRTKDASLQGINAKYKEKLPSNISPIINFKSTKHDQNDFLHHGSSSAKNVYLLLLEDL